MFELHASKVGNLKNDVLSGLTVALALVPEAVAFAFVAGVEPLVGLYAAFMVGLITSIFGGRPGMISGATGAMAVVMVSLVAIHGVEYLFACVVLTGVLQILAGIFKLGKFIRLVPHPVMLGFVNGLAIVIFLAQLGQFKVTNAAGELEWMMGTQLYTMAGLIVLTMAIIHFLPKLTKAVPSSLVAIVVVTILVQSLGLDARTVVDFVRDMTNDPSASIAGGLPQFSIPNVPFNLETLKVIFPFAIVLAAIGLIESLLTLTLIDELTGTRGRGNKECIAQGASNAVNGFFGGMGGCAMIGQSMINVNSGGRGRASGITAALALLFFIVVASSLIEMIPIAALVGVMFMMVIETFAWSSFRILKKIPVSDAFVLIIVSAVTVFFDLAIAVFVGVIISALSFAWTSAKKIRARKRFKEDGTKIYEIWGPLFFGSITEFNGKFDIKNDPENIEIDFVEARISDHSAIEAIYNLVEKYEAANKKITLKHLSEDCKLLLFKSSPIFKDIIVEDIDDPRYHLAANPEDFPKPIGEYKF